MDRLVVLHSHPTWLPRTQTWMHAQVRWLPQDVESHVVCDTIENLDQFPVPHLHALERCSLQRRLWERVARKIGWRAYSSLLPKVADQTRARVLHSHFGPVGWADRVAARRKGLAHVVTFYGADVNQLPVQEPVWRDRYRQLFDHVDRVLCEGPHMRECVIALGADPDRVKVHHLGVDVDGIAYEPRVWSPVQPLRVLLAGTFREKKGHPYGLAALAALRRSGVPLQITLVGAGFGKAGDDAETRRIHEAIAQGGLADVVALPGLLPYADLLAVARAHHVFLAPSVHAADGDTEGGAPVTLIEFAAAGMPVVSTTHCDIPNVLQDGVSGLLAPERDAPALAAKLRWLVDHPGDWRRLTDAARQRIEMAFSARRQGVGLAEHYRDVLRAPRGG